MEHTLRIKSCNFGSWECHLTWAVFLVTDLNRIHPRTHNHACTHSFTLGDVLPTCTLLYAYIMLHGGSKLVWVSKWMSCLLKIRSRSRINLGSNLVDLTKKAVLLSLFDICVLWNSSAFWVTKELELKKKKHTLKQCSIFRCNLWIRTRFSQKKTFSFYFDVQLSHHQCLYLYPKQFHLQLKHSKVIYFCIFYIPQLDNLLLY